MRVLLFSDNFGTPLALRYLPADCLVGIVGASIRPRYHGMLAIHAVTARIPFIVQPPQRDPGYGRFFAAVRELQPELLLVNSYSMRVPNDVLELASLGGVNVHGALLPSYRGANPIQWALINNETETGVTMHHLTPEFDAGDVIAQRRVQIHLTDTWVEVQARIANATEDLLREVLPCVLAGRLEGRPQDAREARHYRRRTPEDGKIDWGSSVLRIYNLVRALVKPHPGAFYEIDGIRHVLDTYKSLVEITTIKANLGALSLRHEDVSIAPDPDRARPLDSVWFTASAGSPVLPVGTIGVCGIDYRTRTAQLRFGDTPPATHVLRSAGKWVAAYAVNQLELARLNIDGNARRILDEKILGETMAQARCL